MSPSGGFRPTPPRALSLSDAMVTPIPPGRLRELVTDMELDRPPEAGQGAGPPCPVDGIRLVRHAGTLTWDRFGPLFRAVGEPWLWRDRLRRSAEEEARHLADPGIVVHIVERIADAAWLGFCEMDRRDPAAPRVLYFGLRPDAIGGGLGRWLFDCALTETWRAGAEVVRLDTCTHDHPRARAFYESVGFRATGQRVVEADDPRLDGLLPRETAPAVPLAPLVERPPALRTDPYQLAGP